MWNYDKELNYDEKLYYAANLMFQCRVDWSDAGQIRDWLKEAKTYLPKEYADAIDDDYIKFTQIDGRNTRDSFPNYEEILGLVDGKNITQDFRTYIDKKFEFYLNFDFKRE